MRSITWRHIVSIVILGLIGSVAAAVEPSPPDPDLASATRQPVAHARLSPLLNQLWASRFSQGFVGDRSALEGLLVGEDGVEVVVESVDDRASAVAADVGALGGVVETVYRNLVFATVDVGRLPELADADDIVRVRTPYRQHPEIVGQGVSLHHADALHADGFRGQGVKVGVFDCGGFVGYQALLGTELPASVTLWQGSVDPVGSDPHGTACAEIVYDLAPEAQMFLAHNDGEAEYYLAVDWLLAQGVDVISYSCGWTGPFPDDGSGLPHNAINAKVEEARAAGVLFVKSAGNSADGDNYQGQFTAHGGSNWHSFDGDTSNGVFSWSGDGYYISLTWDDWPTNPATSGATQDYALDLWWYDGADWQVVASSDNPQNGNPGEIPFEEITFTPPVDEWYYVVISKIDATEDNFLNLKKTSYGGFLHHNPEFSITVPGDSPAATTVGAIFWNDLTLEPFSSCGPTLGPGGTAAGGLLKPDIVAADGVSGATYGISNGSPSGPGFFGTSAAAPHVAGGAALLLSAVPSLSVDELEAQLLATAVDMGPAGPDSQFGHGRMWLESALIFADGFESGGTGAWSSGQP